MAEASEIHAADEGKHKMERVSLFFLRHFRDALQYLRVLRDASRDVIVEKILDFVCASQTFLRKDHCDRWYVIAFLWI